ALALPQLIVRAAEGIMQPIHIGQQRELAAALDASYLFIQGPPGTGKTWTGARLITHLMRRGRRVGVTATSHKVIHNLLAEVERAAADEGLAFRGLKKTTGSEESEYCGTAIRHADDLGELTGAG